MAVFSYRTEELRSEVIKEFFVETRADRKIIEEIKSESPTIVEGSRGTGKSFLMRIAEIELVEAFESLRVLPVYVSFKESSLVQAKHNKDKFLHWMMAKLCAQLVRALRLRGLLDPAAASLMLERGRAGSPTTLESVAERFEESWRTPGASIEVENIPDVDEFVSAVEEICDQNNVSRICILFDEAAHVFRLQQQHAFFSLFRDLRSPQITCNAAVYPGITSFGPTFEMAHDATLVRVDRNVLDENYVVYMKEIVAKQVSKKIISGSNDDKQMARRIQEQMDISGGNFDRIFPLLAYTAHGNPRHLLKTIGQLSNFKAAEVSAFIKTYYRDEVWKEHTTLGDKFSAYKQIVDWGREFVQSTIVPQLIEINLQPENRGIIETTAFFWISRDAPEEAHKALSLLAYVGLVQELDRAMRVTRRQLGTRYMVHLGVLLADASEPLKELDRILPHLAKKRMVEYGKTHKAFASAHIAQIIPDDLMTLDVIEQQLNKSIDALDLTYWQKETLVAHGYSTVKKLLEAGEDELKRNIYMIGEIRARQINNSAKSAIMEYLLG